MPNRAAMLAEIQATLTAAVVPSLTTASSASDVYEAYLFSLVIEAARSEGATISYGCISGGPPNPFVFRTSPGYIASDEHNYGYAVIEFQNCPVLEAHVGVRVAGHSHVLHECDVSVIWQDEAQLCRNRAPLLVAPRSSKLLIAVEAKHYTGGLPLHLGRAFLGLERDLSAQRVYFVANRGAGSIEKLLAHKKRLWDSNINPTYPDRADRLHHSFRNAFKDFKATSSST
jgi:hypothetical protein